MPDVREGIRPRPEIIRYCQRCDRAHPGMPRSWFNVISPNGVAHIPDASYSGTTACGIDATGDKWWWPV